MGNSPSTEEPKWVPQTYNFRQELHFPVTVRQENTINFSEEEDEEWGIINSPIKQTHEPIYLQTEKQIRLRSYNDDCLRVRTLCRSEKEKQVRDNQYYKPKWQENRLLWNLQLLAEVESQFKNLSIADERRLPPPRPVKFNSAIIKDFLKNTGYEHWCGKVNNLPYILDTLENDTPDFSNVKRLFKKKNHSYFQVTHIEKLYNPYLLMQYKLKEKQYGERFGYTNEKVLFHGTKATNKVGICNFNFDWRLNGRHKFGQGVSFASISSYATHYSGKSRQKIMFVVDVLINNQCLGNKDTIIPPTPYDTTTNNTKQVLVKYEDNAFYPSYIIHYEQVKARRTYMQ